MAQPENAGFILGYSSNRAVCPQPEGISITGRGDLRMKWAYKSARIWGRDGAVEHAERYLDDYLQMMIDHWGMTIFAPVAGELHMYSKSPKPKLSPEVIQVLTDAGYVGEVPVVWFQGFEAAESAEQMTADELFAGEEPPAGEGAPSDFKVGGGEGVLVDPSSPEAFSKPKWGPGAVDIGVFSDKPAGRPKKTAPPETESVANKIVDELLES